MKKIDIREYLWFETPLRRLALRLRDKTFSHPNKHRWIRKLLFSPKNRPFYDSFDFKMDEDMAWWIVNLVSTQRALSSAFVKKYPNTCIYSGDQYDGMWLQRYAKELLGLPEDYKPEGYDEKIKRQAAIIAEFIKKMRKKDENHNR